MTVASPSATRAPVHLRHRRSVRRLSEGQLADLRQAITLAQGIGDDRGYQYWAGIHGLPLPMYCKHGSPFFLPWHRAYLYFFEKTLQEAAQDELVKPALERAQSLGDDGGHDVERGGRAGEAALIANRQHQFEIAPFQRGRIHADPESMNWLIVA